MDGRDLRTFAGVKPGDQLRLHQSGELPQLDVNVIVPIDAAALSYQLWTSCGSQDITNGGGSGSGSGTPGGVVSLYGCGATIDLVVETRNVDVEPLSAIVRTDVPVADGATTDLSGETYAAAVEQTLAYANVPAGVTMFNASHAMRTMRGVLHEAFASADVTAGAASVAIRRPAVPGATAVISTTFFDGGLGFHTVADWGPAGPYTFDGTDVFLREYTSAPRSTSRDTSSPGPRARGRSPTWCAPTHPSAGPTARAQSWRWTIAAPYDGDSLVFPVLPGAEAELNPAEGDTGSTELFMTMKVPGSYDAARAVMLTGEPRGVMTGTSGRAVLEILSGGVTVRRDGGGAHLVSAPARRRAR